MDKSFSNQDTFSQDDKQDILNINTDNYDNIIEIHSTLHIKEDSELSYTCIFDNCGAILVNKLELEDHCSKHIRTKYFKCEVNACEKIYRSKENLTLHIKNIHLNLKPYKCSFCSSTFSHRNG
jgi:hypothetical protein